MSVRSILGIFCGRVIIVNEVDGEEIVRMDSKYRESLNSEILDLDVVKIEGAIMNTARIGFSLVLYVRINDIPSI